MVKPFVAVTAITRTLEVNLRDPQPQATVHRRFGELITAAGAVPVFVTPDSDPDDILDRVDAVIVNGGEDVDPVNYGTEPHPELRDVDRERDSFELSLARKGAERQSRVLGICRGMHIVNVAHGGTLVQHLPELTTLEHECRGDFDRATHSVRIEAESILAEALGRNEAFDHQVNSVHHQAVDRVGPGLVAIARAPDGVVEAIEGDSGRTLGIQWHPEFLDRSHDPAFVAILRRLLGPDSAAGA